MDGPLRATTIYNLLVVIHWYLFLYVIVDRSDFFVSNG